MTFRGRFAAHAEADLARDETDWTAERALEVTKDVTRTLAFSPFSHRKVQAKNPFPREMVIPFGAAGYVALFEIENASTVTVLAVRHQREDDYH